MSILYEGFEPLAVITGLEPATSAVTVQHSNQLSYITIFADVTGVEPAPNSVTS